MQMRHQPGLRSQQREQGIVEGRRIKAGEPQPRQFGDLRQHRRSQVAETGGSLQVASP